MRRYNPGLAFALAAALAYGASLPLSRLAFDHGTNAPTVAMLRFAALSILLTFGIAGARRHAPALSTNQRRWSVALGLCFASVSLGTLNGAALMPVSLTVLIFYTYPSLILGLSVVLDRRRPRGIEVAALIMAFVGLAIALDVSLGGASLAGLGFATLAAVGAVATFAIIERALPGADGIRCNRIAALSAAGGCALALAGSADFALPVSSTGWLLLGSVITLFATAVVCMFVAIRRAGSVRASMLLFLEPVFAIGLSVALLAETLDVMQWLGASLVIAAVVLVGRVPATRRRAAGSRV